MNENSMVTKSPRRNQFAGGRHFLLGTAIVLLMVLGYGVGISLSKPESPDSVNPVISVQKVDVSGRASVDKISREIQAGPDRRLTATEQLGNEIKVDPEKRRKLALLLLFAGGQVHKIRL